MGNGCFGKHRNNKKGVVHDVVEGVRERDQGVRIKVRMTRGQLSELIGKVDMSSGNSELGRLIVQQCSNGKLLHAPVLLGNDSNTFSREQRLRPIQEHEEEEEEEEEE